MKRDHAFCVFSALFIGISAMAPVAFADAVTLSHQEFGWALSPDPNGAFLRAPATQKF
jgi:hypothetical protein